jgi:mRNA interferase HigB
MHVISRKKLRDAWTLLPELEIPLRAWIKVAEKARWHSFPDVRASLRHSDQVGKFTVFDILRNRYLLLCVIHYNREKVYVRQLLTHSEYDRGQWKRD